MPPTASFLIADTDLARSVMRRRQISQTQLALKVGVSGPYLSLLLSGRRSCSENTARAISQALHVPGHLLFVDRHGNAANLRRSEAS
jgi:transcriptional regulator with XRE-family HTH domain